MDGEQLLLVGGHRGQHGHSVEHAEFASQSDGQIEAQRVERVITEVIGEIALIPDDASRTAHVRNRSRPTVRRPTDETSWRTDGAP